jgi:hypothetical protein
MVASGVTAAKSKPPGGRPLDRQPRFEGNIMSDWQKQLGNFFAKTEETKQKEERPEFARFISEVVMPAFEKLAEELKKHGRDVTIRDAAASATLLVHAAGKEEFMYRIQGRTFPNAVLPYAELRFRERKGLKLIHTENMLRSGPPNYALSDITVQEVIGNFIANYTSRVGTD